MNLHALRPSAARCSIPFLVLAGLATLSTAAMDMVVPLLATIDRTLPGAGGHPGLVISMFPAGSAVAQLFGGPVSDRLGRRRLLLVSCGVYAIACVGCAVAGSFAALAAWRLAVGAGGGVCLALTFAMIRDTTSEQRTAATVAKVTAAMWASSIVAAPLAAWLLVTHGWRPVFGVLAAASAALLASLAACLPETLPVALRRSLSVGRVVGDYRAVLADAGFRAHAVVGAMAFSVLFIIGIGALSLLQLRAATFGIVYGVIVAGLAVGSAAGNALLARGVARSRLQGASAGLMLGASAALLAVALWHSTSGVHAATAALLLSLASLAIGVLTPCSIAAGVAPFGQRAGTAASALGIARMVTAAAVSALVALLGATDPVIVSVAMSICAALALAAWLPVRAPRAARVQIDRESTPPSAGRTKPWRVGTDRIEVLQGVPEPDTRH